jgi:hypothetical protein
MKPRATYLKPFVIFTILFLSFAQPGYAQEQSPLTAQVDRTTLSTDETLTLTVTVNGTVLNPPQPVLPTLAGFSVVGHSTSSQVSIINGAVTAQTVYSYRLQPTQPGELVIDSISLTLDGQTYTTAPIKIQVTQGGGGPQIAPSTPLPVEPVPPSDELAGQDLFVEAEVDNPTPYVGQQIGYTFRFYQAVNLFSQPQYDAPSFNGFWSEQQSDQPQYTTQAAGRTYRVIELKTTLFPTAAGSVTIDRARLTIPGDFFSRDMVLETEPVEVQVKPLPPDAPNGFNGAVGQFTLSAEVDSREGKVNEPITLRVTLSGQGNLNTAPDPVWPEIPNWRSFQSQATTNTQIQDEQLGGSRIYEQLFVPGVAGDFTIPSVKYIYFDPVDADYKTLTTDSIPVFIAPGAAETPVPILVGGNKEAVEYLATDIRHLKPAPTILKRTSLPLTEQRLYWFAWGMPLLALVGHFTWQWRQQHWQANADVIRRSQAGKRAKKALAGVKKQPDDLYTTAGQILTRYLADKLNRPVAGLTQRALAELLAGQGLEADLIEQVKNCLATSELGRFAPEASDPAHGQNLLKEVEKVIDQLDKAM